MSGEPSDIITIRSPSLRQTVRSGVSGDVLARWQSVVNLLAEMVAASCAVVLGCEDDGFRVLVSSQTAGNPFREGERIEAGSSSGVGRVDPCGRLSAIAESSEVRIPRGGQWKPIRGMSTCLAEPLVWPDGEVFGAVCILDREERVYTAAQRNTLAHFKRLIDLHLQLFSEGEAHRSHGRGSDARRRVKLKDQLAQAQKMELLGCLATGIAHDFNNLIMVILHSTQRLSRMLGPDPQLRETLSTIEQAAYQANDVTRSLLSFSRDVPITREPVQLCAAVEDSARLLKRTLPESIHLVVSRALQPPLWISANITHLQQILLNLAINARDAMPHGGTLRVTAAPATAEDLADWATPSASPEAYACLCVSDTGVGIPPEIQTRVFEPFFTTKPPGQGTGLGLASVRALVHRHRGHIVLQSERGKGTTFRLLFPRLHPQSWPLADSARDRRHGAGTVLLVAADPHLRGIVAMTLESLGYDVLHAADGQTATQRLEQQGESIRGLVVDADQAEGPGWDWLAAVRRRGCSLPAIVIRNQPATEKTTPAEPGTRILEKPFNANELGRLLGELLAADRPPEDTHEQANCRDAR